MDGILSQDEINALLSGMDLSSDSASGDTAESAPEQSQPASDTVTTVVEAADGELLTDTEKDAVGEIANISMGSSATTLYSLVNQKVNITTPLVTISNWDEVIRDYQRPFVFIQIRYTEGLNGSTIMILNEQDVKVITDLMMGGDGSNTDGEIGELHLSAISEAMNQMMGASATSMSTMLGKKIDISPPEANRVDLEEAGRANEGVDFLKGPFVKVSFRMQIGELIDSIIMQLYPIDFAKNLYEIFITAQDPIPSVQPAAEPEPQPYVPPVVETPAPQPQSIPEPMAQPQMQPQMQMGMDMNAGYGMPQMQMGMNPGYGMPQMQMGMNPGYGMPQMQQMPSMNIQPAQFQSFSAPGTTAPGQENIGIIMDVPLEVTVELGRTKKSISEILDFTPGTIIELDKIAGEPVDVLVNGKYVAKGEVVVIEESFGVRVTEIIK